MAVNESAFGWLNKTGLIKNVSKAQEASMKPKVTQKTIAVQRPPEYPSRTPIGPREGWKAGPIKSTAKEGVSYVNTADLKGTRDGDGWPGKKDPNPPARIGKETELAQPDSPGDKKAKAASPMKGVETKSASSDVNTHAAKRVGAHKANIEGNESAMYERLEEKTLKGLKGPKEKVLREGHNNKSMKPGGGGRFAKLKASIAKRGGVKDPGAVAAAIGRKKYGSKQMAKWSASGRKRG